MNFRRSQVFSFSSLIPIELIEQVTTNLVKLPEIVSTPKSPAGYFKINDLLVPILNLQINRPVSDIVITGFGKYQAPPELNEISFTTTVELPRKWMQHECSFSVSDKYLPFELTGRGHFSSWGYDVIAMREMDSIEKYDYCLSCEIDQYKIERDSCNV